MQEMTSNAKVKSVKARRRRRAGMGLMASAAVGALLLAGCGGGDDDSGAGVEEGNAADFSLYEWGIDPTGSPTAGSVTLNATNDGGELHEMLIVKADSADGFEVDETGKVVEDQFADGQLIGEITEFDAGTTSSATYDLEAGTYVVFCNLVEEQDDGTSESHFQEGMVSTFEVS